MSRLLPRSMVRAIWVMRALVGVTGLTAIVTWYSEDELVTTWAEGNSAAQEVLQQGGLDALRESSINIPAFVPVALVLFVVWAALAGVLVVFFRGGHPWARLALTALALFGLFSSGVSLARHLPALFSALAIVSGLLYVALVAFLWHPDTSSYLRHGPKPVADLPG